MLLPLLAVGGVIAVGRPAERSVVDAARRHHRRCSSGCGGRPDRPRRGGGARGDPRRSPPGSTCSPRRTCAPARSRRTCSSSSQTIDRVRTDLVSTVSHELRTPLTSVRGYLELLQDQLPTHLDADQQAVDGGVIRRNLDRLNELIANLLALSRAEETELTVEAVDLRAVATEVGTDIRLTAAGRDITVRTMQSAVAGHRARATAAS